MLYQVLARLSRAFVFSALPLSAVGGLPTAAVAVSLSAPNINQLYVFGDSLSELGNSFDAIGVPPAPYVDGRFSNGPVWVEYLADDLNIDTNRQTNFAFGGANTGTDNTLIPGVQGLPGLQQQINSFTATHASADPNALYIVWAGANDYLGGGVTDPNVPVSNLSAAVSTLATVGAKNIMVVNLANLGQLPGTSGNSQTASGLNALTQSHNALLDARLGVLSQDANVNIMALDVNSLFSRAINNPEEFGFTNVTESCLTLTSICTEQEKYLFWDAIHPTTTAHELIGELAYSALQPEPVPEPNHELGVLVAVGVGATVLKYKQRKNSKTNSI